MAKRFHDGGLYDSVDSRRKQERADSMMISEDRGAIANLPQQVMMKPWPGSQSYMPENLDDTIKGINEQMSLDNGLRSRHMKPKKV